MNDMQQQVAQDLAESGLFGWANKERFGQDTLGDYASDPGRAAGIPWDSMIEKNLPWPTSDQAEAILGEIKPDLQVVRTDSAWAIVKTDRIFEPDCLTGWYFIQIPKGQRTLANNAALAWFSKQPRWKPILKAAIERLGWV